MRNGAKRGLHLQKNVSVGLVVCTMMRRCPSFLLIVLPLFLGDLGCRRSPPGADVPKEMNAPCIGGGASKKVLCTAATAALCAEAKRGVLCRENYIDELGKDVSVNNWTNSDKWNSVKGKVTWYDFQEDARVTKYGGMNCLEVSRRATVLICGKVETPKPHGYAKFDSYKRGIVYDDVVLIEERSFDGARMKAEVILREAVRAGSGREFFLKQLSDSDVPLDQFGAELLPFGVDPIELGGELEKRKAASAATKKKTEEERSARLAANALLPYPARCGDVGSETHNAVEGAPEMCVPKAEAILLLALASEGKVVETLLDFKNLHKEYGDDNPFASFLEPSAVAKDQTTLTATERQKIAKDLSAKTFLVQPQKSAKWSWVEAASKLSLEIDLSEQYRSFGAPSINRTQDCLSMNTTCGGRCDSDSDCSGFTCGCPSSVCSPFGRCTPCSSTSLCTPDFKLTVPKFTASQILAAEGGPEIGRNAQSLQLVVPVHLDGAWRRVFADPQKPTELEHDTGIFAKLNALGVFGLSCGDDPCGRNSPQVLTMNAKPFSVVVESAVGKAKVECKLGVCTGKRASDEPAGPNPSHSSHFPASGY